MSSTPGSVHLYDYDPTWPERFRALVDRARSALGDLVVRIEHVGSTSLPGLVAKPVIDLDIVIRPADLARAIERLASLGYVHKGNLGIEGREAFGWPVGEEQHHLYACVPESRGFRDHLLFRDYLRAHPSVAREYAELKRELAQRHRNDRDAYQLAKSPFIDAVTERAAAASASSSGTVPPHQR